MASAGFIGSWLRDILVCSDAKVHGLDNLSSGLMHDIRHLLDTDRIIVKSSDVTHPTCEALSYQGKPFKWSKIQRRKRF